MAQASSNNVSCSASPATTILCRHMIKLHAVDLIGTPEIGTAVSESPKNCSKYTRPLLSCKGGSGHETNNRQSYAGGKVQ